MAHLTEPSRRCCVKCVCPFRAGPGSYQVAKISAWITDLQGIFTAKQTSSYNVVFYIDFVCLAV
jgi:hypothetical protein